MNRIEAHKILVKQMKHHADESMQQVSIDTSVVVETSVTGEAGINYSLEISFQEKDSGKLFILGKIHDNNVYKFSLLEEELEI